MGARHGWNAIFAHPLFSTAVPVWFGATFALSSLAVRGEIIEQWVLSSQLDLILPMATPPLGMTARILLAGLFGALGLVLGWLAVRAMVPRLVHAPMASAPYPAETYQRRPADAHPDTPARRPIWAHAELGEHGFDHPAPVAPPAPGYAAPVVEDRRPPLMQAPLITPVAPAPAPEPQMVAPKAAFANFPSAPVDGPSAADHIYEAPLDSLSHIELVTRLSLAMRNSRDHGQSGVPAQAVMGHIEDNSPVSSAPDGTAQALRAALNALREAK
jgi:hypothetical protein